jgi:hypothetical protein
MVDAVVGKVPEAIVDELPPAPLLALMIDQPDELATRFKLHCLDMTVPPAPYGTLKVLVYV